MQILVGYDEKGRPYFKGGRNIYQGQTAENDPTTRWFCTLAAWPAGVIAYKIRLTDAETKRIRRNATARARHDAYTSCGLVRVKGALGGTYYE